MCRDDSFMTRTWFHHKELCEAMSIPRQLSSLGVDSPDKTWLKSRASVPRYTYSSSGGINSKSEEHDREVGSNRRKVLAQRSSNSGSNSKIRQV